MRWKNFLLDCEYCGHLSSHISNACSRLFSFFSFITTWCPDIKTCLITFMMFYNIAQTICQLDFSVACALNAFFLNPLRRLAPVFSLFVPFYLSIPRMPVTQVLGHIHITNKSLVYIVGLQVNLCSDGVGIRVCSLRKLPPGLIFSLYHFSSFPQLLTSSTFMWPLALSGLVRKRSSFN